MDTTARYVAFVPVGRVTMIGILWLPVQILGFLFQEMPRSVVAMDRIDSVLRVEPERRPDPEPALVAVQIGRASCRERV